MTTVLTRPFFLSKQVYVALHSLFKNFFLFIKEERAAEKCPKFKNIPEAEERTFQPFNVVNTEFKMDERTTMLVVVLA